MDSPQPNPLKPGPIEPREIYQVIPDGTQPQ